MVCCEHDSRMENLLMECSTPAVPSVLLETYDEQLAVLIAAPTIRSVTWSYSYIWNKLYRRERLTISFRNGFWSGEDLLFNWEYICNCRSMAILPEKLYFYRPNPKGIMSTYNSGVFSDAVARYGAAFINLWGHLEKDSPVRDKKLRSYIGARAAYMAHGGLWRVYGAGQEKTFAEEVALARRLIRDHAVKVWRNKKDYSGRARIMVCLCRYFYPLWAAAAKFSARGKK